MKFKPFVTQCLMLMLLVFSTTTDAQENTVSFENDIKPILENHCIRCHGPEKEEVFRVDERETFLDYVSTGEPEESEIYTCLVTDDEEELMPPPDEDDPLNDVQIKAMEQWIAEGAVWAEGITLTAAPAPDTDDTKDAAAEAEANKVYNAIGSLHPAAIHLPIGLLMAAGLFALLAMRGNFVMSDCAYYCLWLGTIGAIIACVTGWWFGPMEGHTVVTEFGDILDQDDKLYWHRISGLVATIFAFVLALFAASARAKDPDDGFMWKLGLVFLAAGIAWVGHEGGELTWGKNHYKDLKGLVAPLVDQIKGSADSEDSDEDTDDEPAAGETSDESGDSEVEGTLETSDE